MISIYKFQIVNETVIVVTCCPGFAGDGTVCFPICDPPCENGFCQAHNLCKCDLGYRPKPEKPHQCEPHCAFGCVNGTCEAPNKCTCGPNAVLEQVESDDGKMSEECVTRCEPPCSKGKCVGTNQCECYPGYEHKTHNKCIPICKDPCVNSKCVEPDFCMCWNGYVAKNDTVCEPFCHTDCANGFCKRPFECECSEGFVMRNDRCQKTCKGAESALDCVCDRGYGRDDNGNCRWLTCDDGWVSENTCNCFNGQIYDNISRCVDRKVEPGPKPLTCEERCGNGICYEDYCMCHIGFRLQDGGCKPSCESSTSVDCVCDGFRTKYVENGEGKCKRIYCLFGEFQNDQCTCPSGWYDDGETGCRKMYISTTAKPKQTTQTFTTVSEIGEFSESTTPVEDFETDSTITELFTTDEYYTEENVEWISTSSKFEDKMEASSINAKQKGESFPFFIIAICILVCVLSSFLLFIVCKTRQRQVYYTNEPGMDTVKQSEFFDC